MTKTIANLAWQCIVPQVRQAIQPPAGSSFSAGNAAFSRNDAPDQGPSRRLQKLKRILSWLLKKYNDVTVAVLIGFMLGSLPRIWPFQHDDPLSIVIKKGKPVATKIVYELPEFNMQFFWCLVSAVAGLLLVMAIEYAAIKKQSKAE